MSKLRSQVSRQKSDLQQLKSTLPGTPQRRFDPSKAFQHNKENRQTEATPLKEGEHETDQSLSHPELVNGKTFNNLKRCNDSCQSLSFPFFYQEILMCKGARPLDGN